jgi:uncharacterized protein
LSARHYSLFYGEGVTKDKAIATPLFKKACDGGNMRGCINLGNLYSHGKVSAQDLKTAARLYTKACNCGDAIGCCNLGSMYGDGMSVAEKHEDSNPLLQKSVGD